MLVIIINDVFRVVVLISRFVLISYRSEIYLFK